MGATTSSDLKDAVEEVEEAGTPERVGAGGIKLYKFVHGAGSGAWQPQSASAQPAFYNANEDRRGSGGASWSLEISGGDIDVPVDQELQYVASQEQLRITFNAGGHLWALKFPSEASWSRFLNELQDNLFYNTYGVENDEAGRSKVLGADYSGIFFNADAAAPEPMEEDDEDSFQPGLATPVYKERQNKQDSGPSPIQGLVMGGLTNTYLLHSGGQFDVLRNVMGGVDDTGVSFNITPVTGRTPSGAQEGFTPSKVLMTHQETKMNLLSPVDPTRLYHADVEYQKVVSEWKFDKDGVEVPIREVANDSKAAQLGNVDTFLGLDGNRLARWDLRDRRGVVQESPVMSYLGGKDYARGTNFTCMATSGDGFVVVGSADGRIRLYNSRTLTQAKTSIPGLGAPITSVDVSYDAHWVLATTDNYLLVIKTVFNDAKSGKEVTGFEGKMGSQLPTPRLLRLKPEDVALAGGQPLRNAKFTWITEQGRQERWIVASVGNYSVVWNFRRVKTSSTQSVSFGGLPTCTEYNLAKKDEAVVDSSFMHDSFNPVSGGNIRDSLVVATPHKVFSLASD